ncbi:MAG: proline dehydrogenase [Frankiales bacterium]|nr:proline dehydrogenase [Frankiales bacterium]
MTMAGRDFPRDRAEAAVLRQVLLGASGSTLVRTMVTRAPVSRDVVRRFVAGETVDAAVAAVRALVADGLQVSLDRLGEDVLEPAQATATTDAYVSLFARLGDEGLAGAAEASLKLSAIGQALDPSMALDNARRVCDAAAAVGSTVTVDMEDHSTTDLTLGTVRELRDDFPWVGAVLQAYLRRTESDCVDLAGPGSRVRLCKGAYQEPGSVAYQDIHEVDRSYVRCLKVLMAGEGYPMVATHDPRLIEIAGALAARWRRGPDSFEYQMLYGIRPQEQIRLASGGGTVRVYLPYGEDWYAYFMRRLAERPANVLFFLRSVVSKS